MKYLLIFIPFVSFAQTPYVAKWTSGLGFAEVQQSADRITFVTIGNSVVDSLRVPGPTYYYRVKINGIYSNIVKVIPDVVPIAYSVSLSGLLFSKSSWYDNLTWVTANESNVSYYLIERTTSTTYYFVAKIIAKGSSKYSYSTYRKKWSKYRIRAVYTNTTSGNILYFN